MNTNKKPRKVRARYLGPGTYFPGQGEKRKGDTVEVWDFEVKGRWDLELPAKSTPAKPAK